MAVVTNTFTTYDAKGIREDLSDLIADISPTATPFQSNIGSRSAENTYFEWQTDSLSSASATPVVEGQDLSSYTAVSATTRLGNYCQINMRDFIISGTEQKVIKAGRSSEVGYQAAKTAKELKRDVETACLHAFQRRPFEVYITKIPVWECHVPNQRVGVQREQHVAAEARGLCRGTWERVTIDQSRHLALQTF